MRIFIADFETTPFNDELEFNYFLTARFVCFKNITPNSKEFGNKYTFNIETDGKEKVKEFILNNCSLKNHTRIYFHNLRFDLAFLYELIPINFKFQVIRNNSTIICFRVFKERNRIDKNGKIRIVRDILFELRDSLVLLLSSVEKIGISLGFPKLIIDYNIKEITQEYIDYCYRDIEVIELALNKVLKIINDYYKFELTLKNLPLTLPSLAKKVFHKLISNIYGKQIMSKIYDKYSTDYESNYRDYYYGGRVEVFNFNCCFNGYYNDFNSHYGAIMNENEFPLAPYKIYPCYDSNKCFLDWSKNENIFACVCNVYENLTIPLVATKINDKLVFANGKKKCFLFRKEIEYLIKLKQKVEILETVHCEGYLPIFKEFIEIAYEIKASYTPEVFEQFFAKIFMLSIYGKFAEKREKETIEILHSLKGLSDTELSKCSSYGDVFIKREIEIYTTIKINIFYSMLIASLARLKLHKEILNSKNPFYCDSDSIVSADMIENSKELGHLKPEFTFEKFQALGCKEYIIEKYEIKAMPIIKIPFKTINVKMKGFGKLLESNFKFFISHFKSGKKQNRMIGFIESFNRGLPLNMVLVYDKFKRSVYDKRFINSDLTTRAFDLEKDNYDDLIKNNEYYIQKIINSYRSELE